MQPPISDQEPQQEPPPENIRGRLLAMALYIALSIGLYFLLAPTMSSQEELHTQIERAGIGGVGSYLILYVAQMFVPWLPGSPLEVIGGTMFGVVYTLLLSTVAASSGGMVIYYLVRAVGLEAIVARFPHLLESPWRLVEIINRQPWALIAVNMLTGDVAYFVAGAARTPPVMTLLLLGFMRIPTMFVWASIGEGLISNALRQQVDFLVAFATIGTIGALLVGFAIARRFLPGWLERIEARTNGNNSDAH